MSRSLRSLGGSSLGSSLLGSGSPGARFLSAVALRPVLHSARRAASGSRLARCVALGAIGSASALLVACDAEETSNDSAELRDDDDANAQDDRDASVDPDDDGADDDGADDDGTDDDGADDDGADDDGAGDDGAGDDGADDDGADDDGAGDDGAGDDGAGDDGADDDGAGDDGADDDGASSPPAVYDPPEGAFPILFVTQVPVEGFTTLSSAFGNHRASMQSAPRGGDLMLLYPDGTLRNLTQEAGFGSEGEQQGADAIAVREPSVHWSGDKAVFSMVVGAPTEQYEVIDPRWQLYEVTGLGEGETASISKVAGQPQDYNNVSPIYATNGDDILFTSDRPRDGSAHLYPQLDEYESAPTVVGIYRLAPESGELTLIEHSPSGAFSLSIDSFGRVIFTKWDHLQRDQQALPDYAPITFADESSGSASTTELLGAEVFPESRETEGDVSGHRFNQFFPWEINEDGTAEETINHVGRHELGGSYTEGSFIEDDNLSYYSPEEFHANRVFIRGDGGTLHLREAPHQRGVYYATVAPEFYTASGGYLVALDGHPDKKGDQMTLTRITAEDDGHYRSPLPLHDGRLVAVYTPETEQAFVDYEGDGSTNYDYRLYVLAPEGDVQRAAAPLTEGIQKRVTWWDPDRSVTWDGELWELDPVEVVERPAPAPRTPILEAPERAVFDALELPVDDLRAWLVDNELALIVMRNVTLRDRGDLHQPFNLRVPGGTEAIAEQGEIYDISHLQIFQADALRAYEFREGRRLLARPMREAPMTAADGPAGSVEIAADGSVAAFVPARRALAWQLVDPDGEAVVRERNWLSFQAGEIRSCPVCHGLNSQSQLGTGVPENEPEALRGLLQRWMDER